MQTVVYWIYQEGYFNCILQLKYNYADYGVLDQYNLQRSICSLLAISSENTANFSSDPANTPMFYSSYYLFSVEPIRVTQCNTQFRSLGVKVLCEFHLHDNIAFTFRWYGYIWNKSVYSQRIWIGYNIELAESVYSGAGLTIFANLSCAVVTHPLRNQTNESFSF